MSPLTIGTTSARLLVAFSLISGAQATEEHKLNRSLASQASQTNIKWSAYDSASPVFCGTACRYWQRSAGRLSPPGNWTFLPITWPTTSTTSYPTPATFSLVVATPTDEITWDESHVEYDTNYLQKSQVSYTSSDKAIRAYIQKSGNISTQLAYHVQVQNQSASGRDFFVRFKAPLAKNIMQAAYEIGGPSGDQPMPIGGNKGLARSSVQLLVDGLPVWQTAKSVHVNNKVSNAYGLHLNWGEDAIDDSYIIYLGRYASAERFTMDYIIQADAVADAPICGDDYYSFPTSSYIRHCQVIGGGREITNASYGGAAFEIISTQILPVNFYLQDYQSFFSGMVVKQLSARMGGE
jgi:hypothetical protein